MKQISNSEVETLFPVSHCSDMAMFGALSQDSITFLLEHGRVLHCLQGETLLKKGDISDRFYIILQGSLGYYRYDDSEAIHIRDFHLGEQIGFVGMIGLHVRKGDVLIIKDSYLLEITSSLFNEVCDSFASDFVIFMINMAREMSREISDLGEICARLRSQAQHV
jgi:CRP-like cAMP-binding protein